MEFPTPSSITRLDLESFISAAWDLVGRKVAKRRILTELYEIAQHSIALKVPDDSLAIHNFRLQVQRYLDLTRQRKNLESLAERSLAENPDYLRLKTLPGVGSILALTILAESDDLRRFPHHRHYLKFCRFDLKRNKAANPKAVIKSPREAMPDYATLIGWRPL